MPKTLIVIIIAFIAIVYIYTFLKIRKRKKNNVDAVDYVKNLFNKYNNETNDLTCMDDPDLLPRDFIEKDFLYKSVQDEINANSNNKRNVKKIEFKF